MDRSDAETNKPVPRSKQRVLPSQPPSAKAARARRLGIWATLSELRHQAAESLLALPMLFALLGAILGIALQKFLAIPTSVTLVVGTASGCIAMIASKWNFSLWSLRCASGLAWLALTAALYQLELETQPLDTLKDHADRQWQPLVIEGVVREPLRYRPQSIRQTASGINTPMPQEIGVQKRTVQRSSEIQWTTLVGLEVCRIVNGGEVLATSGMVTVAVDGMLEQYLPGDRIRVAGRIQRIGPARNPGEPNYQEYMQRRGEWVRFRAESAEAIERESSVDYRFALKRYLAYLGQSGRQQLAKYLPEPQCSLAAALLLGQREQVGNEINEKLLATGTIHLLSISGLHVEMIAVSLLTLALICRVPRSVSLLGIGSIVLAYAMVTGSNPPVVRATVLVLGVLAGRWIGRPTSVFNMLGLAGTCLLIYQPSLLFDLGTQLSFLAVFCLVLLSRAEVDSVSQIQSKKPADSSLGEEKTASLNTRPNKISLWLMSMVWPWFKSVCSMNVGVWLATTPLVLFHFNIFSPIALVLNVLLWLPVLVAMLSGLGLMMLGWIPLVGPILGWICHISLVTIQTLVDWGYAVRGGHVWLPEPSLGWLVIAYVFVLVSMFFLLQQLRYRLVAAWLMLLWIMLGSLDGWLGPAGVWGNTRLVQGLTHKDPRDLRMQVLDVGHGSAVILCLPDGTAWLYDAGRLGDQHQVYKTISQALWQMRVARLDGIILSHADFDHYSGMSGIVNRFVVDRFATGPRQWEHSSSAIQELYRHLQSREIELLEWSRGDEMTLGEVRFKVIHPSLEQRVGSDNARSVCLVVEFAGRRILLPGDLESPGMEQVAALPKLKCDVVMAPHHGSLSGAPNVFLDWCQAAWVLVSGSEKADSPAVQAVYGAGGREVYLTAREHALEACVAPDGGLTLSRWNEKEWELIRELPRGE